MSSLHDLKMGASICDEVLLLKEGFPLGFGHSNIICSDKIISEALQVKTQKELLVPSNSKHITFHLA